MWFVIWEQVIKTRMLEDKAEKSTKPLYGFPLILEIEHDVSKTLWVMQRCQTWMPKCLQRQQLSVKMCVRCCYDLTLHAFITNLLLLFLLLQMFNNHKAIHQTTLIYYLACYLFVCHRFVTLVVTFIYMVPFSYFAGFLPF